MLHFFSHFDVVCCHYIADRIYGNIISVIKAHLSFFKQHWQYLIFNFFCKFQRITAKILYEFSKVYSKFPPSPCTVLQTNEIDWRKLCALFLQFQWFDAFPGLIQWRSFQWPIIFGKNIVKYWFTVENIGKNIYITT